MDITERNVNRDNKQIQGVYNDMNNMLSLQNREPKQNRAIVDLPPQKTISYKKTVPYDQDYAKKNNTTNRSSYHDDLINNFSLKTQDIKDDTHVLLTSTVTSSKKEEPKRIIEKVKPKNQVSGITDKNLMSHLILPSSLAHKVVPKNNIKSMGIYRKADTTPLPLVITPVRSIKEKMVVIK